jgi:hypothetical protein
MSTDQHEPASAPKPATRLHVRRLLPILAGVAICYLLLAYFVAPLAWRRATRQNGSLSAAPRITHTANGISGDPLNLAVLGSESNLVRSMIAAKWYPADPITLRSSLRIAVDSVFRHPDEDAPVSDLFLFDRKQDLAFELPVGNSPRQRHHVRFWHWDQLEDGREVWFGAATFDERVGLSHTTGQITHHVGPDVDAERDLILSGLKAADRTEQVYYLDGFHQQLQGRNGGGDPWHTDGRLGVARLLPLSGQPSPLNQALTNSPK